MKLLRSITATAFLVVAIGAGVGAITFGRPDLNAHPYVGTIILQTASGYFSCSGTLLSPTVFLTAGHCTEEAGVVNLNTWAKFTPDISFTGIENYATINDFFDDPANGWIPGEAIPHPNFDDFSEFPATYDVGVVLLEQNVVLAQYGALPQEGFLETIRGAKANQFTAVGYGLQGLIRPFFSDLYTRYQGQVRLVELNSTFNGNNMSAKFTNNPGRGGGTCFGDSGGPILYGNTNIVTAVISFGFTPCIGVDYNFRVDTAIALDFVTPYLD